MVVFFKYLSNTINLVHLCHDGAFDELSINTVFSEVNLWKSKNSTKSTKFVTLKKSSL